MIRFTVRGLIVFSIGLMLATSLALLGYLAVTSYFSASEQTPVRSLLAIEPANKESPAWGDLTEVQFDLERPSDCLVAETNLNKTVTWVFQDMDQNQGRAAMLACGLSTNQVQRAFSPGAASMENSNLVIKPSDELVLELPPKIRSALYQLLSSSARSPFVQFPIYCPEERVSSVLAQAKLNAKEAQAFRNLLYPRNEVQCFSDMEVMLRQCRSGEARRLFLQALLKEKTVLAQLNVGPDSDIDKLMGYWAGPGIGVRFKDVRPLLESLQRTEEGGRVTLLYFLPVFARERLYNVPTGTNPRPGSQGSVDFAWSTMNFFQETPDDRFYDNSYVNKYLLENFYQIAFPSCYGDRIFLLDEQNHILHSAVHLAGDLVFTKAGDRFRDPWVIMHLKDLTEFYSGIPNVQTTVWRNRET